MGHILAQKRDGAGRRLQQRHHRPRERSLAAAAFADDAQGFALADLEADPVDGPKRHRPCEDALANREPDLDVLALHHDRRIGRHGIRLGSAAASVAVQPRHGLQQGLGVIGARSVEHLVRGPLLHEDRVLHDADPVGEPGHNAHVVGDQHHGGAGVVLQLGHQVQHLGLHGDVQGRGRLVGDQQLRPAGHGGGDHHPLAHAAGELVRVLAEPPGRFGNPHPVQPLARLGQGVGVGQPFMPTQGLGDLLADLHMRGQGCERVLEDHGHPGAADAVEPRKRQTQQLGVADLDRARRPAVARQEAHHRHEGLTFARPALADHAQALAAVDGEAHALHGLDHPVGRVEANVQVGDAKDRWRGLDQFQVLPRARRHATGWLCHTLCSADAIRRLGDLASIR